MNILGIFPFRGGALKPLAGLIPAAIRHLNTCPPPPPPIERTLKIGQHKVNFVEAGAGAKGVILLPGALGTAWTDFKPQIEQLPVLLPNHKIIAWDPPGYGKSRPPEKEFGLDFYERDAEAAAGLMEKMGFGGGFSVAGWSDGGITGMILAGRKPSQVEKLVIWGSNAYIAPKEAEIYESMGCFGFLFDLSGVDCNDTLHQNVLFLLSDIRDVSKWSARMREPMEKVYGVDGFPKVWSAWVDGMLGIYKHRNGDICKELLDKILAPTFILHGAKDPMIVPEHVPHLQSSIANTS